MSNFLYITELVTKEFLESPVGTFGNALSCMIVAFTILKKMLRPLDPPIQGNAEFFARAGVPVWPLRFFAIGISLKKVPVNTRADKIFIVILISISVGVGLYMSYLAHQVRNTPENSVLLVYKPTGENFSINKTSAHGISFFRSSNWSITSAECDATNEGKGLSAQDGVTSELAVYICEVYKNKESEKYLTAAIERFKKEIYFIVSLVDVALAWFSLGLVLTFCYKAAVGKYIRQQNELAMSYVM